MKNALRLLSLMLALIMSFSVMLTACGNQSAPETTPTEAETQPTETEPTVAPTEEYTEPLVDGYNQVTFYWSYPGTYENCDMWIWWGDVAGKGYLFHECEYGAKVVVNVPEDVEEVGFIVRRDCSEPGGSSWGSATKDYEPDRFAKVEGRQTEVYLKTGDEFQYKSDDGGKTLTMSKKIAIAGMTDKNVIQYRISPKATISNLSDIKVYEGDREVKVAEISSLGKEAAYGDIVLEEDLNLAGDYRIVISGYGEKTVIPTGIFDSQFFADNYHYDGTDLGATVNGNTTTFKVWAPTASKLVLNLFEAGNDVDAYKTVEMTMGEKGVWIHTEECGHGTYYTYTVTTAVGTQEAVDPYAKAAGVNGNRGMVVDLSLTDPEGWNTSKLANPISSYTEAIIWEVHVRDFSNTIADSQYKGKYLAFTETGLVNEYGQSVGVDYLKELGITHVHLLPVYDYATVDETNPDFGFNWGYDPKNYNVPEGSYSTDPYNGEVRIREFKQMVMALHEAGISVVMDVVYNHTYDGNSSFNRLVPYYYYRYTTSGENTSASGCGNDTASERYMFGKFMVESTAYWVEEYKLDGLRFDLMGLHDVETMQEVESAVHAINPNAILYGEGWTMGATIDGSAQANQSNISQIKPTGNAIGSVAVFNDAIRDGLKGSVFDKASQGYINGQAKANLNRVVFGILGGTGRGQTWTVENAMVINYMSAHDNNTLWDKLLLSNPNHTEDQRNKMNNLGAAIVMISRGTPFWQAGEEMLRTKDGDENSYKSSDAINNIKWSVLQEGTREYNTMLYYKGLIQMRKSFDIFTANNVTVTTEELGSGILIVNFDDGNGGQAKVVINPNNTGLPCDLGGEWNLVANGETAGNQVLSRDSGTVTVAGISVLVYVNDKLVQ
ncbi:MAG: type I pullulanase [Oscillospiraceae bacterium]|nr:type I pullulanase [Oscillospiraceae bacterium]